jgi:hypothetical protein
MPRLACWSCGRQVHATSPLAALFVDERRLAERRLGTRRSGS